MELTITAKVQIIVSSEQGYQIDKTMEIYRQACNFVSEYVFRIHELRYLPLHNALYTDLRKKFGIKSQMAQSVVRTVRARYKAILESQKRWIKPEFKKPQLDLVRKNDYTLAEDYFSVNTLNGRLHLPYCKKGMEKFFASDKYKFGTAHLVHERKKYYLHIPVTFEVEDVNLSQIENVVGIDRGINFVIATFDNNQKSLFVNGGEIKQKRAKYQQVRSELQRRGTPSARRRPKAIGHRENRWMQDVNHCVSKALVESYPEHTLFVLEDLTGIRSATESVRRKYRYVTVSWAFYDLELKIMYKAALHGDLVIKEDPRYTSQRCPKCGHTEKGNRDKKNHIFCCRECGYSSNDDRIGAMNLYQKGIEKLIKEESDAVTLE